MDADQVGLGLLAGFLSCAPVTLLGAELVASSLEGLPAHVTLILVIIRPRICRHVQNRQLSVGAGFDSSDLFKGLLTDR